VRGVVHLVDSRHTPTRHDLWMVSYLAELGLPALVVLTKVDKLTKTQRESSVARALEALGVDESQLIEFSAKTGRGRDELLAAVSSLVHHPADAV
jgi:GTP-binding protein